MNTKIKRLLALTLTMILLLGMALPLAFAEDGDECQVCGSEPCECTPDLSVCAECESEPCECTQDPNLCVECESEPCECTKPVPCAQHGEIDCNDCNTGTDEPQADPSPVNGVLTQSGTTVTFKNGDAVIDVYSEALGLTKHETGDGDTYYISDNAPVIQKADWPAGAVSFKGWFLDSSDKPFDLSNPITESIILYAHFSSKYLITFKDGDGKVVYTREYDPGALIHQPDTNTMSEVELTAPAGSHFEHWYIEGESNDISFFLGNKVANSDLTLIPKFTNHWYVIFVSAGSQAADPLQLVEDGNYAAAPIPNPTRAGYTFKHWSEIDDGNLAFDFANTPITKDITLYAVWTAETVNYTVAIWMEKPGYAAGFVPGHPGGDKSEYNYVTSLTFTGTAGTDTPNWSLSDLPNDITDLLYPTTDTGGHELLKYGYYQDVEVKEIQGNGLTVVNLYVARKVYTYIFDLGTDTDDRSMTVNGTQYTAGSTTRFQLQVKYEMDISGIFPVQGCSFATFDNTSGNAFSAWNPPDENNTYSGTGGMRWESTAGIASIRKVVDKSMLSQNGQQMEYILGASWTGTGDSYEYRYLAQILPGETPDITLNGTGYKIMPEYNQQFRGNLGQKPINGFIIVTNSWTQDNYSYTWLPYNTDFTPATHDSDAVSSTTLLRCFFYLRSSHTLRFDLMVPTGTVVINAPTSPRTLLFLESLAGYKPTPDPSRDGYIFAGWYRDSDFKEVFDFENIKMPNGPIIVYAKWESNQNLIKFFDSYGGSEVDREGVANGAYATKSFYNIGDSYPGFGEFTGWHYLLQGKLIPFSYDIPIWKNYDLYAVWKTDGFTVIYNAGTGTGTVHVDPNKSYELGTHTRALSGSGLTHPSGLEFYAWQSSVDGKLYYPGNIVPIYGNTTLTAQYASSADLVTITYIENFNGSITSQTFKVKKDDYITLQGEIFKQGGSNKLIGWADAPNATLPDYNLDQTGYFITGDKTFYGVWTIDKYTVTYKANGGFGADAVVNVVYDENYTIATNTFTRTGYTFTGWNTAADGTGDAYAAGAVKKIDGDLVLYARWVLDSDYFAQFTLTVTGNSTLITYDGGIHRAIGAAWRLTNNNNIDNSAFSVTLLSGTTSNPIGVNVSDSAPNVVNLDRIRVFYNGVDVTALVVKAKEDGALTISPRPITIAVSSASKVYNGISLYGSLLPTANLVDGHYGTVLGVDASILNVGSITYIPYDAKIYNTASGEVTSNYAITYRSGVLTITAPGVPPTPPTPPTPPVPPTTPTPPKQDKPKPDEPETVIIQEPVIPLTEEPEEEIIVIEEAEISLAATPEAIRLFTLVPMILTGIAPFTLIRRRFFVDKKKMM